MECQGQSDCSSRPIRITNLFKKQMFPLNDPSTPGLENIIKPLELFKKRLYNLYKYRSFDNPVSSCLELSLEVGHPGVR